jgi:DNA-directed RNA polymerase subunit RPC12/RpoP
MNTSESQMLWVGLAILVLLLFFGVAGIRLVFRIDGRLRELLRIATEIEAMIGQIRLHSPTATSPKPAVRRPQVTSKTKPATGSCNCQHCGREFLFYLEGFTEEKSFGRCPGCGKLTKLRLPSERKFEPIKTDLIALCGTCATRIPFSKSEEWSKTTCPVCGSETILQSEESEIRRGD